MMHYKGYLSRVEFDDEANILKWWITDSTKK